MNGRAVFSNRRIALIAVTIAALPCCTTASGRQKQDGTGLRAGVARVDITPEKPVTMAGYAGRKGLSNGVHDPLSARVVFFEDGDRRLVVVSTDLIGFYGGTAEYLRKAILEEVKLQPSELLLTAIHTHSGPSLTIDKQKGHKNNLEYTGTLKDRLIRAIRSASDAMAPVSMGAGTGYCPIGANRRELRFDRSPNGSIVLGRSPYGPTDKQVQVVKLAKRDGTTVAVMFDYATHGTCLGGGNVTISGDVIGLAEQFVEKIIGGGSIAPAFAGASGNIDPWFRVLPGFNEEPGWIPEPVLLGTVLGEEVVHVFRGIKAVSTSGRIRSAFEMLNLPGKPTDGAAADKPPQSASLALTVARVGNIAFVGMGAEVLTEIGMAIKSASPYEHTLVITHCNGAAGYLAPEHLYVEGGYEIRSSPFGPKAADMVVKRAVKILHDLQDSETSVAR
ncbi:MAG: neutral/alkaline non-lysosomal ceramidase N-terminal domain-containing protein [Phycisphaerales bacterium]|nr:MAG: neutral/alkaline non-lysosomal ceramidase N-terminal domain-containing protein [Phycisphaerales bacterium]